jgi:hypothetical protein
LCPGSWTRNAYGNAIREAFTSQGQLKIIIDFSDVDSFETSADAYPHFFVFEKDSVGPTQISSMVGSGGRGQERMRETTKPKRQTRTSGLPLSHGRAWR